MVLQFKAHWFPVRPQSHPLLHHLGIPQAGHNFAHILHDACAVLHMCLQCGALSALYNRKVRMN